jgi:hypothetical protein
MLGGMKGQVNETTSGWYLKEDVLAKNRHISYR